MVCLQEIKASPEQVPGAAAQRDGLPLPLARSARATRASGCTAQGERSPSGPTFAASRRSTSRRGSWPSQRRTRRVGVGVRAERRQGLRRRRCGSSSELEAWAGALRAAGQHAGAVRRLQRRAHRHRRAPEASASRMIGQLPEERALIERCSATASSTSRRHVDAGERPAVHVVGAVAQHAAAQHRLAPRLRRGAARRWSTRGDLRRRTASSARAITGRWWRRCWSLDDAGRAVLHSHPCPRPTR